MGTPLLKKASLKLGETVLPVGLASIVVVNLTTLTWHTSSVAPHC